MIFLHFFKLAFQAGNAWQGLDFKIFSAENSRTYKKSFPCEDVLEGWRNLIHCSKASLYLTYLTSPEKEYWAMGQGSFNPN